MKNLPKNLSLALCIAYALYPVGTLIARLFGYDFAIFSEAIWFLLLLGGTIGCFLLLRKTEESYFWCGLIPLFAMGNWICCMTGGTFSLILAILMFFTTIPLSMRHTGIDWLKVTTLGITGLLCMPLMGISLLGNMASNNQPKTTVDLLTSPNGAYYVECVENKLTEKESLAVVKVYEDRGFNIGICSASKLPIKLHTETLDKEKGEKLEIEWKDDTCIIIDGKEYPIN